VGTKFDVEGRAEFALTTCREGIVLLHFHLLYFGGEHSEQCKTYYFGLDATLLSEQFHRDSPRLVVSGHPYVGSNGTTRRVEKEILGPSNDVTHFLWHWWNRSVDEVLSANRDARFGYTQIVGGYAAYLGWYRSRFILARVKA
jgi:hypothetical protein